MYPESYAEEEKRKKKEEECFETLLDFSKLVVDTVRSCNTLAETETSKSPIRELLSGLNEASDEELIKAAKTAAESLTGELNEGAVVYALN